MKNTKILKIIKEEIEKEDNKNSFINNLISKLSIISHKVIKDKNLINNFDNKINDIKSLIKDKSNVIYRIYKELSQKDNNELKKIVDSLQNIDYSYDYKLLNENILNKILLVSAILVFIFLYAVSLTPSDFRNKIIKEIMPEITSLEELINKQKNLDEADESLITKKISENNKKISDLQAKIADFQSEISKLKEENSKLEEESKNQN